MFTIKPFSLIVINFKLKLCNYLCLKFSSECFNSVKLNLENYFLNLLDNDIPYVFQNVFNNLVVVN